ncbi:MAG: hypothetical protein IK114_14220 [Fibrobacter sp.]|nr:hypothetical protein [Fibrobacter sp.]
MKDFFKKIWDAIKNFVSSLWKKVVDLLLRIPVSKYVYFILGMIACAFLVIVFPGAIAWPIFPLAMLAAIICFIRVFTNKEPKWWNALAFVLGAFVIQLFAWI